MEESDWWHVLPAVHENHDELSAAACEQQHEGIVAKRIGPRFTAVRHEHRR